MFKQSKTKNNKDYNSQKGFSLIEIIVSFALFTIIMTVSLGALLVILDANAKAKSLNLVINNLSLSLESMSRELRVGSLYCDNQGDYQTFTPTTDNCDTSGTTPSNSMVFRPADADATSPASFSLNLLNKTIQINKGDGSGLQNLTGSDIRINDLEFYIRGTRTGDLIQPSVLIRVQGDTEILGIETSFNIQTMVSQRKLAP